MFTILFPIRSVVQSLLKSALKESATRAVLFLAESLRILTVEKLVYAVSVALNTPDRMTSTTSAITKPIVPMSIKNEKFLLSNKFFKYFRF